MAWHSPDSHYESIQLAHSAATVAGTPVLIEDTYYIPMNDAAANEQNTFIWWAAEITADKTAGVAIAAGDLLRIVTASGAVTNAAKAGTNSTSRGFANEAAVAAATSIKMSFDGRAVPS